MRTKLALLTVAAVFGALALAPSSNAATRSITVKWDYNYKNLCRAAVDQVGFQFEFFAKIKRKNAPYPKNVVARFKVLDAATGAQRGSGKVTLTKRNKWRKTSGRIVVPAGMPIVHDISVSYKNPSTGRTVRSTYRQTDSTVPTVEQMDTAANPLPACA